MLNFRRFGAAAAMLVASALGHLSCSSSPSEQPPVENPNHAPLVTFVPVRATLMYRDTFSWHVAAPVQHIALVEHGTMVTMRASRTMSDDTMTGTSYPVDRPEVWYLPKDGEPAVHFESLGTYADAEPTQTKISWGAHSITLDLDKGEIVGGVYRDPDGKETRFAADGTATPGFLWDDTDDEVSNVLKWAMQCRGHIVIKGIADKFDAVKGMLARVSRLADEVTAAASHAYTLYTKSPVDYENFPKAPVEDDIVKLAKEIEARSYGKKADTSFLPAAYTKNAAGDDLVEATWEVPRVRCVKERRAGTTLVHTEQACAADVEACEASGGVPGEVGPCRDWCEEIDNLEPKATGSGDDSAYCTGVSCVEDFAQPPAPYNVMTRSQCCEARLWSACEDPDAGPDDSGSSDSATDSGSVDAGPLECGRFQVLERGMDEPPRLDGYGDGSGRVKDTVTGKIWTRNRYFSDVGTARSFSTGDNFCKSQGMRMPTQEEFKELLGSKYCDAAFAYHYADSTGKGVIAAWMWTSSKNNPSGTDIFSYNCINVGVNNGLVETCDNAPAFACVK